MSAKLFPIADLDAQDVHFSSPGEGFTAGGESFLHVATDQGEARRWTRTDLFIVRGVDGRHWGIPCEVNPTDHDGGAEGFHSHLQFPERTHVEAAEMFRKEVVTVVWRLVP